MTSREDVGLLHPSMNTGVEGLKGLEKFVKEGTQEVKKLLYDECDILIECRYCRNLFRSAINFIAHKRSFCRVTHAQALLSNRTREEREEDEANEDKYATKKRLNILNSFAKRLELEPVPIAGSAEILNLFTLPRICKQVPVTTIENGYQKVVGTLPYNLAMKEAVNPDNVIVAMPVDNSSRYQDMNLRNRKFQKNDNQQSRSFTATEMEVIKRFDKHGVKCGNFVLFKCDHQQCADIKPFHSIMSLAYHCTVRHTRSMILAGGEKRYPCLLCARQMWSRNGVERHVATKHKAIKDEHEKKRAEYIASKPGKRTAPKRASSLDPKSSGEHSTDEDGDDDDGEMDEEEEEDEVAKSNDDYEEPPVLTAVSQRSSTPEERSKSKKSSTSFESSPDSMNDNQTDDSDADQEQEIDDISECVSDLVKNTVETLGETYEANQEMDEVETPVVRKRGRPKKCDQTGRWKPSPVKKTTSKHNKKKHHVVPVKRSSKRKSEEIADAIVKTEEVDSDEAQAEVASASSTAVRPSRDRKRPRWMESDEMDTVGMGKDQRLDEKITKPPKLVPEQASSNGMTPNKTKKPEKKATPPKLRSKEKEKEKFLYTPRAGKHVVEKKKEANENISRSKRKQNLGNLIDSGDDFLIVGEEENDKYKKKSDLADVPVYLSEGQQKLFFAGLKQVLKDPTKEGSVDRFECEYCLESLSNIRDGRRHMVGHIRVMRLKCSLCGVGAFFCIDMRHHLMRGGCPKIKDAPNLQPGIPCMTKEQADQLTFMAHTVSPGRSVFTSGMIVSIMSTTPYLPNPVIEEKILGPSRVPNKASPKKSPLKLIHASSLLELPKDQRPGGDDEMYFVDADDPDTDMAKLDDKSTASSARRELYRTPDTVIGLVRHPVAAGASTITSSSTMTSSTSSTVSAPSLISVVPPSTASTTVAPTVTSTTVSTVVRTPVSVVRQQPVIPTVPSSSSLSSSSRPPQLLQSSLNRSSSSAQNRQSIDKVQLPRKAPVSNGIGNNRCVVVPSSFHDSLPHSPPKTVDAPINN